MILSVLNIFKSSKCQDLSRCMTTYIIGNACTLQLAKPCSRDLAEFPVGLAVVLLISIRRSHPTKPVAHPYKMYLATSLQESWYDRVGKPTQELDEVLFVSAITTSEGAKDPSRDNIMSVTQGTVRQEGW